MKALSLRTLLIGLPSVALLAAAILVVPAVGQEGPREAPPIGTGQAGQLTALALEAIHAGNYKDAIHALHSAAFILEEGLGMHMPGPGMGPMPLELRPFGEGPHPMALHMRRLPDSMDPFKGEIERVSRLIGWLGEEHGVDVSRMKEGVEQAVSHHLEGRHEEAEQTLRRVMGAVENLMRERGIEPPEGARKDFPTAFERVSNRARELQEAGADLGDIPDRLAEADRAFDEQRVDEAWEILRAVNGDLERIDHELREE